MQGPPEHVESVQFLDEAQILSAIASDNGIHLRLDRANTLLDPLGDTELAKPHERVPASTTALTSLSSTLQNGVIVK